MIVVIDTNVVLDALLGRKPFFDGSCRALEACVSRSKGCITANSLTDIYYILSKSIDSSGAKQAIGKLMELYQIISLDAVDCINALELTMDDFEDTLIAVCAEKIGADYIVSRDCKFAQTDSPVQVISPADFLSMGGFEK